MNTLAHSIFVTLIYSFGGNLFAATPSTVKCPKKHVPAEINLTLEVSTRVDCPLLEDKKFQKLLKKFTFGSVYAYPTIPETCVSGENLKGTVLLKGKRIQVDGNTESAQRIFPEAIRIGDSLFVTGISSKTNAPFASGAAITFVSVSGIDEHFDAELLLSDRFTLDFSSWPIINTEDFLVIGSNGDLKQATGRLIGTAEIISPPPTPLDRVPFKITGTICVK